MFFFFFLFPRALRALVSSSHVFKLRTREKVAGAIKVILYICTDSMRLREQAFSLLRIQS